MKICHSHFCHVSQNLKGHSYSSPMPFFHSFSYLIANLSIVHPLRLKRPDAYCILGLTRGHFTWDIHWGQQSPHHFPSPESQGESIDRPMPSVVAFLPLGPTIRLHMSRQAWNVLTPLLLSELTNYLTSTVSQGIVPLHILCWARVGKTPLHPKHGSERENSIQPLSKWQKLVLTERAVW